jgi:Ala-tRNA(Pro) deacylase
MDQNLLDYLQRYGIKYLIHKHPAVFTVKESKKLIKDKSYFHTKSLFLKDENGKFYLVCMNANKRLDIKNLKKKLFIKELHFASSEDLNSELNLAPGSVSIFGMIYAKPSSIILLVDKEVWGAETTGFHPNINTATLEISHENLEKFCNSLKCKKEIIAL